MKLKFFPNTVDKESMNNKLIDTLIELSNKSPNDEVQFANRRMACVVEIYMSMMEKEGKPITRETLLETFQNALEKHRLAEELEKSSKTA